MIANVTADKICVTQRQTFPSLIYNCENFCTDYHRLTTYYMAVESHAM